MIHLAQMKVRVFSSLLKQVEKTTNQKIGASIVALYRFGASSALLCLSSVAFIFEQVSFTAAIFLHAPIYKSNALASVTGMAPTIRY